MRVFFSFPSDDKDRCENTHKRTSVGGASSRTYFYVFRLSLSIPDFCESISRHRDDRWIHRSIKHEKLKEAYLHVLDWGARWGESPRKVRTTRRVGAVIKLVGAARACNRHEGGKAFNLPKQLCLASIRFARRPCTAAQKLATPQLIRTPRGRHRRVGI